MYYGELTGRVGIDLIKLCIKYEDGNGGGAADGDTAR